MTDTNDLTETEKAAIQKLMEKEGKSYVGALIRVLKASRKQYIIVETAPFYFRSYN